MMTPPHKVDDDPFFSMNLLTTTNRPDRGVAWSGGKVEEVEVGEGVRCGGEVGGRGERGREAGRGGRRGEGGREGRKAGEEERGAVQECRRSRK